MKLPHFGESIIYLSLRVFLKLHKQIFLDFKIIFLVIFSVIIIDFANPNLLLAQVKTAISNKVNKKYRQTKASSNNPKTANQKPHKDQNASFDYSSNAFLEKQINQIIQQQHYEPKILNDTLSKDLFGIFLANLDYSKIIFLASDIKLLNKYQLQLDNEIAHGKFNFIFDVGKIYSKRINYLKQIYPKILEHAFDYTLEDSIEFAENRFQYPKTIAELEKKWYIKLKFMTLQRYYEALQQKKNKTYKDSLGILKAKDSSYKIKADSILEKEAREYVAKSIKKLFFRYEKRFSEQELVNVYLNSFCSYMDPHTNYFPPLEKRAFEEGMSKRFYGIGAQLMEDNDNGMKIVRILVGGAAWKSGQIHQGDVIIKVAQEDGEYERLVGYNIEEAVKLIRGKKDTKVRLAIKKSNGSIIDVPLIRQEVKQEESLVRSAILQDSFNNKIGYIYLPDFYADFQDLRGAQSSYDVAIEIEKLKNQDVKGIIMDLRNNGGGSLTDVLSIAGYFIFKGPVVQIKNRHNSTKLLNNDLGLLLYAGPLIVMVNEFSASASEIFAAAIQDYRRGIIVGTPTYGKGTVQKTEDLKMYGKKGEVKQLGGIKLTVQKFYRINGGSTQLHGVEPDIILPSRYEYAKVCEKDSKYHMKWDEIPMAKYKFWEYNSYDIGKISKESQSKIDNNPLFSAIKENARWFANQYERTRSLNLDKYDKEEQEIRAMNEKINKILSQYKDTLNILPVPELNPIDTSKIHNQDELNKLKYKNDSYKEWLKSFKKDVYLKETLGIMEEMLGIEVDQKERA